LKTKIKKRYKVGVLGGTFDPPHIGHLNISKIAIKILKLDNLIWVVAKQNPLKKKPYLSVKARLLLSKHIVKKRKKISVTYLNNKIKSLSTYKILKYLKKINKNNKLFFIMGSDNLVQFHKWKNWKKITEVANIVVFPRTNYPNKSFNSIISKVLKKDDLIYINSKKMNISSSLIRKF
jgi:nicotinate-nucleotide adenylyltransferase